MDRMKVITAEAAELCRNKEKFALATVLESEGSTPRGAGSKMLVKRDGTIRGTVGGGKIESDVIDTARECLETGESRICEFLLEGETVEGADMTCGGRAEVLIQGIDGATEEMESLFAGATKGYLITRIQKIGGGVQTSLALTDDPWEGELGGNGAPAPSYARSEEIDGCFFLAEALERGYCVYILGGGHVGLKTAELAEFAGFDTVVVDDRPEFASRKRFPKAREVLAKPDFEDCFSAMTGRALYFIVIMTRGHRYDRDVLEQALRTDAPYIGMMGSRRKIAMVFESLEKKGFSRADLSRVTAPIGLDIASETPEEIAVSVLAQLIEKRRRPEPAGE